jgi:hypothetical protein
MPEPGLPDNCIVVAQNGMGVAFGQQEALIRAADHRFPVAGNPLAMSRRRN